jgi:Xaa-Pro aminopeptidase
MEGQQRMTRVDELQQTLQSEHLDGWLFFDFRRSNAVAHHVLELSPHAFFSRRWMYYVPATGTPTKLVSSVESHVLSELPGNTLVYRSWQQYQQHLATMLTGAGRVAMEYVPDNAIPYVSLVDAGTVELIRGLGPEVVSSADFAQRFEAVLSPTQLDSHRAAGHALMGALNHLLPRLREQMLGDSLVTEYSVQREFGDLMRDAGLVIHAGEEPLVAVNGNAANPHYSPTAERHAIIRKGDLMLLDFSAPLAGDEAIFADSSPDSASRATKSTTRCVRSLQPRATAMRTSTARGITSARGYMGTAPISTTSKPMTRARCWRTPARVWSQASTCLTRTWDCAPKWTYCCCRTASR